MAAVPGTDRNPRAWSRLWLGRETMMRYDFMADLEYDGALIETS
ncbi:MAG: hypothetical protein OXL68_05165 [Paracoccaceae bacterium]|nr:hypothetical protein [Paracoccaceae bacterium]